jgi:hypothetical protein
MPVKESVQEIEEEMFFDAMEDIQNNFMMRSQSLTQIEESKEESVEERFELPWLKDPEVKLSIWSIVKDSIG